MEKDIGQLEMRNTFTPLFKSEMTSDQRKKSLDSHLFIEEKRDGKIKSRMVSGGDKQRIYTDKNQVGSPTCKTESILITSVIEKYENRDVATIDIPNSFVQTEVKDLIVITIRGKLCEIMVDKNKEMYRYYVNKTKK